MMASTSNSIPLEKLKTVGNDLVRPESVLCFANGELICSRKGRGVEIIYPDGSQEQIGRDIQKGLPPLLPNGIAMLPDGRFLLADIGERGGIWQIDKDGNILPYLTEFLGTPMPPVNFVMIDSKERVWISVSTIQKPRHLGYRPDIQDGYIMLLDEQGPRIVAKKLHYTNEIRLSPSEDWLYVSETMAHQISRFPVLKDGSLGPKEIFVCLERGDFVDGISFDSEGALWAACIVSNRIYRISPERGVELMISEDQEDWINEVEQAYLCNNMGREHFDRNPAHILRNVSSIIFGGDGLRTLYFGCLLGTSLLSCMSPVSGIAPVHWHWRD